MTQDTTSKFIARTSFRYFLYALLVGAVALCINWEAMYRNSDRLFSEDSVLEYLQVLALLFTALAAHAAGHVSKPKTALASLLVGAASIACIREFDAFLDRYLFDGGWQLLVVITAFIAGNRAWQHKENLKSAISDFLARPSFGMMAGGFLTVFIFSRLIGRQVFWQAVMGDGYMRVVKNAVEESTELLGYILILVGSIEFLRDAILAEKKKAPSVTDTAVTSLTARYGTAAPPQLTNGFHNENLHP